MEKLFDKAARKKIVEAIVSAERTCSGEIRVHIDEHCRADVVRAAKKIFCRLGMQKTKQRNGILFYFATADKRFAVIGDEGINNHVDQAFWDAVVNEIEQGFAIDNYVGGICNAVKTCGEKLSQFFPPTDDDEDELSNDVTMSKRSLWQRLWGRKKNKKSN